MAKNYEDLLARWKVEERRGVWTTYGAPDSWQSFLIQSPDGDPIDLLKDHKDVKAVTLDVTDDVLNGEFDPPLGSWQLLIHSPHQEWASFLSQVSYDGFLIQLAESSPGRWLYTGQQDTAGVLYVKLFQNGKPLIAFETDGMAWDDEEDDDGFMNFQAKGYTKNWPLEFESEKDVHQQLIIDLDAYVPYFYWNNGEYEREEKGLFAGHHDVIKRKHISRIDLIEFGKKTASSLNRIEIKAEKEASKALRHAIAHHDVEGVQKALADGASLEKSPNGNATPLGFTIRYAAWHFHDSDRKTVNALLKSGADPNDGGLKQPTPIMLIVDRNLSAQIPLDILEILQSLISAGGDVNQPSVTRYPSTQKYPLDVALSGNTLAVPIWLLQNGVEVNNAEKTLKKLQITIKRFITRYTTGTKIIPKAVLKDLETLGRVNLNKKLPQKLVERITAYEQEVNTASRDALAIFSEVLPKVMKKITDAVKKDT